MTTRKGKVPTGRSRKAKPERLPLSLDNPPTGYVMSVEQLAELTGCSRNNAYAAVRDGLYPSLRHGTKIQVLVLPTLQILRGERVPGPKAAA